MTKEQVLDRYFLEMRCKVLEVAASLDRIDRAEGPRSAGEGSRLDKLHRAVQVLLEHGPDRAEKVQRIFSREYDPGWRQKP